MKRPLILIFIFFILLSCDQKKSKKPESEHKLKTDLKVETKPTKSDTTIVYWQTKFDTIRKIQDIRIENDIHQLEVKNFSLNDSSIVSINGNYKGIYHDYASEIILTNKKDTVLYKKLTKKIFKDSLNSEFYKLCVLTGVEYDNIRSNSLYFKGGFNVPDTDWVIGNDFTIFFRTEKKGHINFGNFKDIGL